MMIEQRLDARTVTRELERRGELFTAVDGAIGLRGETLALYRRIQTRLAWLARSMCTEEWMVPAVLSLDTLARAEYFASFPQWLTTVSHLSDDVTVLERIASAADPAGAVEVAPTPPLAALPPAVCCHVYAELADGVLASPATMTAQCTCWRHEGDRTTPLERGWAFTMREAVILGTDAEVAAFRADGIARSVALAASLGLEADVVEATDPFFAPTSRGRALLQQVKALKHELAVRVGPEHSIAIASFNHHETFFGRAFAIRLRDGTLASSGCVAFGLERWLLAFLCAHGPDPRAWPEVR